MISIWNIHDIYTTQMKWQELNKIKCQEKSKHKSVYFMQPLSQGKSS